MQVVECALAGNGVDLAQSSLTPDELLARFASAEAEPRVFLLCGTTAPDKSPAGTFHLLEWVREHFQLRAAQNASKSLSASLHGGDMRPAIQAKYQRVRTCLNAVERLLQDARYSRRALVERINSDLANDLGNALHRSLSMLERFCGGVVPAPTANTETDAALEHLAAGVCAAVDRHLESLEANTALIEIWRLVSAINKYIDETEPWVLAKAPAGPTRLHNVMYHVCEALRLVGILVTPFLPQTGPEMLRQLGLAERPAPGFAELAWGGLATGTPVAKGQPLFPRIDVAAALAEEETPADSQPAAPAGETEGGETPVSEGEELISIDEFARVKLRLARVEAAEPVPGADKLLKLQVSLGEEKRQLVAGIARYYKPEELIGKKIVVVANLKPARLRGVESQGMLLAASDDEGRLGLVTVLEDVQLGAEVR